MKHCTNVDASKHKQPFFKIIECALNVKPSLQRPSFSHLFEFVLLIHHNSKCGMGHNYETCKIVLSFCKNLQHFLRLAPLT
jgi:hypothetical protein